MLLGILFILLGIFLIDTGLILVVLCAIVNALIGPSSYDDD